MDVSALGQACDEFCGIRDDRARAHDGFGKWLNGYRHDGIYDLALYVTRHEDGYLSHGSMGMVNWIPAEGLYFGYPSDSPGGAKNYRYEVPWDADLPVSRRGD